MRTMEAQGEVEVKQGAVILHELDEMISALKSRPIEMETVKASHTILKCVELRDIFGKQFVEKLAEELTDDCKEHKYNQERSVEKAGVPSDYIYIVTRGAFIECS